MKHIHKGWWKPGDEIPQPISVVLGGNLRQGPRPPSRPPKDEFTVVAETPLAPALTSVRPPNSVRLRPDA
jgi:hypothetical protein